MEAAEFRLRGKELVDYLVDYLENIREQKVYPNLNPGFLQNALPRNAPQDGEDWKDLFEDFQNLIMPGLLHWQSPHQHGYYPTMNSFPSILGEMIADAINADGSSFASCPAGTELEMIVTNWLGRMIGLPEEFLHRNKGLGGGVIQATASEATLISLLAARDQTIGKYRKMYEDADKAKILTNLVAYTSDQAHSSIEKGATIGFVTLRYVETDENLSMRGPALLEMIQKDEQNGLIPFWVCATLGTTNSCAFDNLAEIAEVCEEKSLWLHVDAAYAGNAFVCPEFRGWMEGIEKAETMVFDPCKWMMVNYECAVMWVKNSEALIRAMAGERVDIQHDINYKSMAVDFMHWQIPSAKKFRSLKLWIVIRNYGVKGLQQHIHDAVHLAEEFETLVRSDVRFGVPYPRRLGLVVFDLVAGRDATESLWERINRRGKIHLVTATVKDRYVIRFSVSSQHTNLNDIVEAWNEIQTVATEVLEGFAKPTGKVLFVEIESKRLSWGKCSLLTPSTTSPSIMNGSFLALHDPNDRFKSMQLENNYCCAMKEALMTDEPLSSDFQHDVDTTEETEMEKQPSAESAEGNVRDDLVEKCHQD